MIFLVRGESLAHFLHFSWWIWEALRLPTTFFARLTLTPLHRHSSSLPHCHHGHHIQWWNFELDENLSDLGLQVQVFCPIIEKNDVFGQLESPLPPLPSIANNSQHNFIEPFSIKLSSFHLLNFEPSSMETMPIEAMPIGSIILRTYPFVELLPVHNCFKTSIRSIMGLFQIFEFTVPFSWFLRHLNPRLSIYVRSWVHFCNEMAMIATYWGCLAWIGHMFVTALTKRPRPFYLAELEYEPEEYLVYHIPSNAFDRKRMDMFLGQAMSVWVIIMTRTLRFWSWRDCSECI